MQNDTNQSELGERCAECGRPLGISFFTDVNGTKVHRGCVAASKVVAASHPTEEISHVFTVATCGHEGCEEEIDDYNKQCWLHFEKP